MDVNVLDIDTPCKDLKTEVKVLSHAKSNTKQNMEAPSPRNRHRHSCVYPALFTRKHVHGWAVNI